MEFFEREAETKNRRRGPLTEILVVTDTDADGNECILQTMLCLKGCTRHLIASEQEAFDMFKDLFDKLKAGSQRNLALKRFVVAP